MFGSAAPLGTRSFGVGFGVVGLSRAHAEGTGCQRVGAVGAGGALLPKYLGVCYRVRGLGERPQKGNCWGDGDWVQRGCGRCVGQFFSHILNILGFRLGF